MKTRMMFLASIVLMGLWACSENEEMDRLYDEQVNTYLTVHVTQTQANVTRTLPDAGAENGGVADGTEGERKISNLMVLLYDESGVLKKTYVTDEMKNTVDGSQTAVFPMGVGKYEVYVVANFSEAEASWGAQPGFDVKSALVEGVDHAMMEKYYAKDNHFMMFNACNGKDRTAGIPVEITIANSYRNPATCTVPLDRLAVKIQSRADQIDIEGVKTALDSKDFSDVKVQWKGFKLLNGATSTYLQQRWTNVEKGAHPYRNTLITPWLVKDTDPLLFDYYAKLSDFRTVTFDENGKYNYVRDNYASMHFYGGETNGPIYCMENNPTWNGTGVVDALRGNTTGLVYQFLLDFDGSDNLAGESCFYAYGGKYFPSLKAIQAAYPDVFSEADESADRAEDLEEAEEELSEAYEEDIYNGIAEFRAKYQIKVFMDGLMYYIYYIKDRNYVEGGENYYAVMRNTVYDLTVRRLLRIGEDIPGGWNPDTRPVDPVDPTETYMNVVVKVNPWVMTPEDIDLK